MHAPRGDDDVGVEVDEGAELRGIIASVCVHSGLSDLSVSADSWFWTEAIGTFCATGARGECLARLRWWRMKLLLSARLACVVEREYLALVRRG